MRDVQRIRGPRLTPRRVAAALLAAYALFVLWVVLRQSPTLGTEVALRLWKVAVWAGAGPTWETFVWAEFSANVGMLVPVTFLASLIWPRVNWRDWTAGVFLFALGVELIQAALLPDRVAAWSDVVANALGGFVGAMLAGVAAWLHQRLRQRRGELPRK